MTTALVLGGADCLFDDEAAARAMFTPDILIATNHAGRDRDGTLDHWVSFHVELFPRWLRDRRSAGRPDPMQFWTGERRMPPVEMKGVPLRKCANWGGSSGLLAVTVALELGCERIVCAGVPLTREAKHYDDDKPWREAGNYRKGWIDHMPEMQDRVRSMSGWTAELLGSPTKEWFDAA